MKTATIIFCIFFFGCSHKTIAPTEPASTSMEQKVPGITSDRMSMGKQLYASHCASCHRLYDPAKYTGSQWDKILPKMIPRTKLSDMEKSQKIKDYVHALAK